MEYFREEIEKMTEEECINQILKIKEKLDSSPQELKKNLDKIGYKSFARTYEFAYAFPTNTQPGVYYCYFDVTFDTEDSKGNIFFELLLHLK